MVTQTYVYMSGACGKVSISSRNGPCSNPASGKIHYGTPSLLFLGAVFVKQCLEAVHRQGLSVGWSGWFVILIAHLLHQRLLPAIINFLSQSNEGSTRKKSGCIVLTSLPVFEIVFPTSIVLYHQCCAALSCL